MSAPLQYVPGQNANLDKLAELYKEFDKSYERAPSEERDLKDPLGYLEKAPDTERAALEATDRLIKFFMILREEFRLGPRETVYMCELLAVNVLNAPDLPLTDAEVKEAQRRARDYYTRHR